MAVSTFEGLALGTTTAAASGFDFVSAPTGGGCTVISTNPYRGTRALEVKTGSAGALCLVERTTSVNSTSTGQLFGRIRFRVPVLPPDATGVRILVITDSGGAFLAEVRLTNAGKLQLRNSTATVLATSALTVAADQWVDLGLAVLAFSASVGQAQLAIWGSDGTIAETLTSAAALNTLGAGGLNKCQAGAIRSGINGYVVVLDDVDWSKTGWPAISTSPTLLTGPWSGAVSPTGFTAAYRLGGTSSARLVVSTSSALTSPTYSAAVAPDADGMVKLTVTGLSADTQYHYGVECDGAVLSAGRGEARTFPAPGVASYSLWFGSCQWTQPADATYTAILNRAGSRALMGIHMGDLNYRDWGPSTSDADVFAQHMISLGSASMAPNLAKIPFNYLWDNHDWCGDTSDKNGVAGNIVAAQYRRVFPTYALPASNGRGGYHSWTVGRVRFIQIDTRSYRDPQTDADGPGKTMLGSEQKAWLKARLTDPEPVKILCGQYYWRQDSPNSGRWGSYATEFAELNAFIAANNVKMYVIFGDRHALCADNGTAPGAFGIPQASGAPIQQGSVAPGSNEPWSQGYYHTAPSTLQGYGWLDIADTGAAITIAYQGVTSLDGVVRVQMTTTFPAAASLNAQWGIRL